MITNSFSMNLLFDILLFSFGITIAFIVKYLNPNFIHNFGKYRSKYDTKGIFQIFGISLLLFSFTWLFFTLSLGFFGVGISLVPTIIMLVIGWSTLRNKNHWMQKHTLPLMFIGAIGGAISIGWLFVSAGILSRSDPRNFYWIFYPSIAIAVISIFAIASPAFQWFHRITRGIGDD